MSETSQLNGRIRIESFLADGDERTLADDVLDGLTKPFKELPPKHLYDTRGSELFDRICELPEYYPTRTERKILEDHAADIVDAAGTEELLELGSGYATKTRVLLDAMADAGTLRRYLPFDVAEAVVRQTAEDLVDAYPGLSVHGVIGDFERHLDCVPPSAGPRTVAFLGGTIGNFPPGSRRRFLRGIAATLGPDDRLLLGTDLVKDPELIRRAYDDDAGITAEFNRNVLHVLNRELGADFEPDGFEHVALFDADREWIEMRLRALRTATVTIPTLNLEVSFAAGEEVRTEISAKFTRERLEGDYAAAGLGLTDWWTDADDLFALSLAAPVDRA
jgi:L-histidine N-alpha-methyltransferase